ncbi:MAG: YheU family protein [Pseudomonadota bacterium]
MAELVRVPITRLAPGTLQGLLEEFASRDGTDYGERETPLEDRVSALREGLSGGEVELIYDIASESWDLLSRDRALELLGESAE